MAAPGPTFFLWLGTLVAALLPAPSALALEYRSINEDAVVLYDAPSLKSNRLFVVGRHLPVEVVVTLEAWVKVRDSAGDLAWVEKKYLGDQRYVIVTAPRAEVRAAPDPSSKLLFEADRDVVLEFVESLTGWIRVRHADGSGGFVRASEVWGR